VSLNTITSAQLLPAAIVAIGADAAKVGEQLGEHYESMLTTVDSVTSADAPGLAEQTLAALQERGTAAGVGQGLPAIAVLATTSQWQDVAEFVTALRQQPSTLRPRVWPTFVGGDADALTEFDARLDELGTGACDLVLMMNGDAEPSAKAGALGAWLHVKMPAPPSVLGELPDVAGKICRYVAIGSKSLGDVDAVGVESAQPAAIADAATVTPAVTLALAAAANKTVSVIAANDAASALCAAAEDLDASALLRAESHLAQALTDVSRQLSKQLSDALSQLVEAELEAAARDEVEGESGARDEVAETAVEDVAQSPAALGAPAEDRTEAVSQLVLLASKGGLSKMFSRSRMTGIAQSVSAAARRDVDVAVKKAIAPVAHEVPDQVAAGVARRQEQQDAARAAQEAQAAQQSDEQWRLALAACRDEVALWPAVDISNVRRSWGGAAPAPRQYVVGSESALRGLPDDDDSLSVIDLRDSATPTGAPAVDIDLRDSESLAPSRRATILLAQYGLPLTAF